MKVILILQFFLLEKVIKENPDEVDAYIFLFYRFMDSFLENSCYWCNVSTDPLRAIKSEYCEDKIWSDYSERIHQSLEESYARFSDNPEYLYYASRILLQAYDFMGLTSKENLLMSMREKAKASGYNSLIEQGHPEHENDVEWAKRILDDSSIQEQLATKGAAADYVLGYTVSCAKKILEAAHKQRTLEITPPVGV